MLGIYYADLFKWWKDIGILDILKEEYNEYIKDYWERERWYFLDYVSFFAVVGGLNRSGVLLVYNGFTASMMLFILFYIQAIRFGFSMAIFLKNGIWKLIFFEHVKED